eukprot:4153828-Pleurochrysis_carterae.AAC.1
MDEGSFAVRADGYFATYSSTPNEQHDTHHLLGLIPLAGFGKEQNAMAGGTTGPGVHVTVLPPVLQTVDALYLRSTMQSESMQTYNFDIGSPDTQE